MKLVEIPLPNGKTIDEKYEYARFLMRCREPTVALIKFLEKEADNLFFTAVDAQQIYTGDMVVSYKLCWKQGELFNDIIFKKVPEWVEPHVSEAVFHLRCAGLDTWANRYEENLLKRAINALYEKELLKQRKAEEKEAAERPMRERRKVTEWLQNYEKQ